MTVVLVSGASVLGSAWCTASPQLRGSRMKSFNSGPQSMYSFARKERETELSLENGKCLWKTGPHLSSWCPHARQEGIGRAWEVQNLSDSECAPTVETGCRRSHFLQEISSPD